MSFCFTAKINEVDLGEEFDDNITFDDYGDADEIDDVSDFLSQLVFRVIPSVQDVLCICAYRSHVVFLHLLEIIMIIWSTFLEIFNTF